MKMLGHSLFYILLVILTNPVHEIDSLVNDEKDYPNLDQKQLLGI
jgi:hypothetical protein